MSQKDINSIIDALSLEKKAASANTPADVTGQLSALRKIYHAGLGTVGGALVLGGGGLIAKARFEDKFKTDREKDLKDQLLGKAPLIGVIAGAALGGRMGLRHLDNLAVASKKQKDKLKADWAAYDKKYELWSARRSSVRFGLRNALEDYATYKGGKYNADIQFFNTAKKEIKEELVNLNKSGLFTGTEKTKSELVSRILDVMSHTIEKTRTDPEIVQAGQSLLEVMKEMPEFSKFASAEKQAELKKEVKLLDHQERFLDRLMENDGVMMAAHATGSGKTLSAIAGFEKLKRAGKAKKAIVVVPAALRENFVDNLKRYTNSSYSVYGPKAEAKTKNIGDKSNKHYNIVSYDLFREHGDQLIKDLGADTLIMDEIHKARGTEGVTYNKLRDLRDNFRNAITLTGSIVNNEPNDVVPLMDITYKPSGHKLVSKKFFDKLFVQKDAVTRGIFSPKVYVEKKLKNTKQLSNYIHGKIDYVSHQDLEKDMPKKKLDVVEVPMSNEQLKIYNFALNSVDPLTRWKIRMNLPVSQREAQDAFTQLLHARQVSTDHGVMDERFKDKNPYDYSPKVKKVVDDALAHLDEHKDNKTVIYGNLITGQVASIEKALKQKGIPYSKFLGMGQEGMTATSRPKEISDFQAGKKRILLLSGAGAEGLDLKNTTMLQMLEGHYNPERIQQAESRVRRIGAMKHLPEEKRQVLIKRYVSTPKDQSLLQRLYSRAGYGGDSGVDKWIYTIAQRKDDLNRQFRDSLGHSQTKKASALGPDPEPSMPKSRMTEMEFNDVMGAGNLALRDVGRLFGTIPGKIIEKRNAKLLESIGKQKLLQRGREDLIQKKHFPKIMAESKIDERSIDAGVGAGAVLMGAAFLNQLNPNSKLTKPLRYAAEKAVVVPGGKAISYLLKNYGWSKEVANAGEFLAKALKENHPDAQYVRDIGSSLVTSAALGAAYNPAKEVAKGLMQRWALNSRDSDLDKGIQKYDEKMKKKYERKYKSSKGFVNEYETKKELGIEDYT